MLKSEVPVPDVTEAKAGAKSATEAGAKGAALAGAKGATVTTKAQPVPKPAPRAAEEDEADEIETGSVE